MCTITSNSTICPQSMFMGFVWFSDQTAITSSNSIRPNQLILATETSCVFFEVRTELLHIVQTSFEELMLRPRVQVVGGSFTFCILLFKQVSIAFLGRWSTTPLAWRSKSWKVFRKLLTTTVLKGVLWNWMSVKWLRQAKCDGETIRAHLSKSSIHFSMDTALPRVEQLCSLRRHEVL
jgi:hypothetical protein